MPLKRVPNLTTFLGRIGLCRKRRLPSPSSFWQGGLPTISLGLHLVFFKLLATRVGCLLPRQHPEIKQTVRLPKPVCSSRVHATACASSPALRRSPGLAGPTSNGGGARLEGAGEVKECDVT